MICSHALSIFSLHSLRSPRPKWFLFGSPGLLFLSLVPVFLCLDLLPALVVALFFFAHRLALVAVCRFLFVGFVVFIGL